MILLCSTISSLKSISGIFAIPSSSFSSFCPCWTFASVLGCFGTGSLTVAFPLSCTSPRTSPCLGHSPLVCFACCWLCSFSCLLLALLSCLLLAMLLAMLFSVLFIISPLLDVERCSASASSLRCSSRCPRTRVTPLSSFHHWLVCCGSVSDSRHLLLGCGSVCISLTTGFLAVALSLILSRDTLR